MNLKHIFKIASYIIGITAIGFVAGFFAGGSGSPVVGIVLPLIFGLIGGGSGLLVAKTSLQSSEETEKLSVLGFSLLSFSIALWFGSLWGASSRTGQSIAEVLMPTEPNVSTIVEAGTAGEAVTLSLLRARLVALGVDKVSIESILQKGATELTIKKQGIPPDQIESLLEEINAAVVAIHSVNPGEELDAVRIRLIWEASLFQSVAKAGIDARSSQILYLGELKNSVWSWINDPDVNQMPSEARDALIQIHNRAMALERWLTAPSWMTGGSLSEEIDDLISLVKTGKSTGSERVPTFVWNPSRSDGLI